MSNRFPTEEEHQKALNVPFVPLTKEEMKEYEELARQCLENGDLSNEEDLANLILRQQRINGDIE